MVDYSSWKTIELSSDEDDVHPFIENGTLFRLRHEARLRKMEERKKEEFAYECHRASYTERLEKLTKTTEEREQNGTDMSDLDQQMKELQLEEEQLKEKENKLKKQAVSWYIDTICHPGFSRMAINNGSTEDDFVPEKLNDFVLQNKLLLKQFSLIESFNDTKVFLRSNPHIIKKQTLYFMISYGMKKYLKGEKSKLKIIARQIICLQHILELFKMYNRHSDDILLSFFHSVKLADDQCKADFESEILKVQKLIKNLVKSKLQEIVSSEELDNVKDDNSEKFDLDAEEVFRSLPEGMQYCFITQDKNALANILANMPADEAKFHMKRCTESGLWIPDNSD